MLNSKTNQVNVQKIILCLMMYWHISASQSREGSSIADDWDERPHTIEEVKVMLQQRKEAALKRERTLSHAFSQQVYSLLYYFLQLLCF